MAKQPSEQALTLARIYRTDPELVQVIEESVTGRRSKCYCGCGDLATPGRVYAEGHAVRHRRELAQREANGTAVRSYLPVPQRKRFRKGRQSAIITRQRVWLKEPRPQEAEQASKLTTSELRAALATGGPLTLHDRSGVRQQSWAAAIVGELEARGQAPLRRLPPKAIERKWKAEAKDRAKAEAKAAKDAAREAAKVQRAQEREEAKAERKRARVAAREAAALAEAKAEARKIIRAAQARARRARAKEQAMTTTKSKSKPTTQRRKETKVTTTKSKTAAGTTRKAPASKKAPAKKATTATTAQRNRANAKAASERARQAAATKKATAASKRSASTKATTPSNVSAHVKARLERKARAEAAAEKGASPDEVAAILAEPLPAKAKTAAGTGTRANASVPAELAEFREVEKPKSGDEAKWAKALSDEQVAGILRLVAVGKAGTNAAQKAAVFVEAAGRLSK